MAAEQNSNNASKIKHLVIASGGPSGVTMYGALRLLNQEGVWNIADIKSMYGSSVGSFISLLLALNYDWKTMDDFLLKRPWSKIYLNSSSVLGGNAGAAASSSSSSATINAVTASFAEATNKAASYAFETKNKIDTIVKLYNQTGIYGMKEFTESIRPALEGKDFTVNVTMQEFFEKTGIELHFIVTELNKFVTVDFSHKTHPNQSVIEACYMSCCYPFIFTPIYRDDHVYLDGGIINDYPVNECIREQKCDISEILGIKMEWERMPANLTEKCNIITFIYGFFNQIQTNLFENRPVEPIPNEVICFSKIQALQDWVNVIKDENCRRELLVRGETFAKLFLSYRRNNSLLTNKHKPQTVAVAPAAIPVNETINLHIITEPEVEPSVINANGDQDRGHDHHDHDHDGHDHDGHDHDRDDRDHHDRDDRDDHDPPQL
jgi:predicted acylesterase/phospholipase RssA